MPKIIMVFLSLIIVVVTVSYYFILLKDKKVINEFLLDIRNQKEGIVISTNESSKYISDLDVQQVNDTSIRIDVYTTTIYNLFDKKRQKLIYFFRKE